MNKIVWDVKEMYDLGVVARRIDEQLRGVDTALRSDITRLDAVRSTLRRYGIFCPSLDTMATYRQPTKSVASISVAIVRLGRQVDNLVTILNEIERQAEARNGAIMGKDLPPQIAAQVEATRRWLLQSPRLPLLLKLRAEMGSTDFRDTDEQARAARRWLELNVNDHATRVWIVENSPDVARLLAENSGEGDAAVQELRAATTRPGAHPLDYFLSLPAERRDYLAVAYPSLVGNLDGAPSEMRGTANKINLVAYREKLFDDLAQSQLQGYQAPNRDEESIRLRLQAIDGLLSIKAGEHVLAFDRPDMITQMHVVVDRSALDDRSTARLAELMAELATQAGTQQGYSQALLNDLDSLSQSKDPSVARFGRETAYELRTTGHIDPGKAADLLSKADYPLAIIAALADAGQRIAAGRQPPGAVVGAFGQEAAGVGAGVGAMALCTATGPGAAPCALIAVGAGIAAEELWQVAEEKSAYAFAPAPGESDSIEALKAAGPETPYAPEQYFVPYPVEPQESWLGPRAGVPDQTSPEGYGPYVGPPAAPSDRPAGWPDGPRG